MRLDCHLLAVITINPALKLLLQLGPYVDEGDTNFHQNHISCHYPPNESQITFFSTTTLAAMNDFL